MNCFQKQIYRDLLEKIGSGELAAGERIPTEESLAERFATTRLNAHYAIGELKKAGLLQSERSRGTFLLRTPTEYEYGQLLLPVSRKVCILNHCPLGYRNIHWNDQILLPLREELTRHGIDSEEQLVPGEISREAYLELLSGLIRKGFGALVVVPGGGLTLFAREPEMLLRFGNHIHLFDRANYLPDCSWCNTVGINNVRDGMLALEAVMERHPRRIIIGWSQYAGHYQDERIAGIRQAMLRYGREAVDIEIQKLYQDGVCTFPAELRPDTVFIAITDQLAVRLIQAGRALGFEPGRDYGLISFDNDQRFLDYELTTLAPNLDLIARILAGELVTALEGKRPQFTTSHRVISQLIRRKTL